MKWTFVAALLVSSAALAQQEMMCVGEDSTGTVRRVSLDSSGRAVTTGAKTNNTAAPGATNMGCLSAVATDAVPSYTEGYQAAQSVDLSGNTRVTGTLTCNAGTGSFTVAGAKTSNAAVPGATNVGTLHAVANASAPSFTEGYQVAASVDLSGSQRTNLTTRIAGENLTGVVGDVTDWLEVRPSGRAVSAPTATTTVVAATACATPSAAGCTIIYASTDWQMWSDITITVRNSDATNVLTQVIVEWSPTGAAGTWEAWDTTTFAALAVSTTKSLAISGNSRRYLRIEGGAAAAVTSAVVNITAAQ